MAIDPLSNTAPTLTALRMEARGSRTRPRNDARRSRGATPDEVADTTPFALIDPDNPAGTLRDIPAGVSCRRLAILASFVIAITGVIAVATIG